LIQNLYKNKREKFREKRNKKKKHNSEVSERKLLKPLIFFSNPREQILSKPPLQTITSQTKSNHIKTNQTKSKQKQKKKNQNREKKKKQNPKLFILIRPFW
jgi:hypothetical protein